MDVLASCTGFRYVIGLEDSSSRISVHRSRKGSLLSFSGSMVNVMFYCHSWTLHACKIRVDF